LLTVIDDQPGSDEIFLMGPSGKTLAASNYNTANSFVGPTHGYRRYFRYATKGDPGFYFAVGATTGIPGLFLSAPVYSGTDDVLGVTVIKIDLSKLEQSWHRSGDAVWVTDEKGVIFLVASRQWRYSTLNPLPNEQGGNLFQVSDDVRFCHPSQLIIPWDPAKTGAGACGAEGIRSDGSRFTILSTLNPIRIGDQDQFILTVQDITELTIEDNGHGMSEDQIRLVFEPFFTTKPMGKGLGLGLAISYSLACDIGAELTGTSGAGKGSCFSLELPIADSLTKDNK